MSSISLENGIELFVGILQFIRFSAEYEVQSGEVLDMPHIATGEVCRYEKYTRSEELRLSITAFFCP